MSLLPKYNGNLVKCNGNLVKYEGRVNRYTYQVQWNWSLRCGYSTDNENWVPPATGSSQNTYMCFQAYNPFTVTVDWGDGQVEQFNSVTHRYTDVVSAYQSVTFRSYMTEVRDNADEYFSWETIPPHHYADDSTSTVRTITMEFSEDIIAIRGSHYHNMYSFPIAEFPELVYLEQFFTSGTYTIPMDIFSNIPNLQYLILNYMHSSDTSIPDSLWTMTNLVSLQIFDTWNKCTDIESSGIRNVAKLQKLQTFRSTGSVWNGTYLKEYNELPNLTSLTDVPNYTSSIHDSVNLCNLAPVMDEVDEINQNLTDFRYISDTSISYKTLLPTHLQGYGWSHITQIYLYCGRNIDFSVIPDYWHEHRAATSLYMHECFNSSAEDDERAAVFIETFYNFVTSWEHITMSSTASDGLRNQWYGMTVYFRSLTANYIGNQPEGLYLPTDGFVQGVSNGNPTTSMERIYVLEMNYNQYWRTIDRPTS